MEAEGGGNCKYLAPSVSCLTLRELEKLFSS